MAGVDGGVEGPVGGSGRERRVEGVHGGSAREEQRDNGGIASGGCPVEAGLAVVAERGVERNPGVQQEIGDACMAELTGPGEGTVALGGSGRRIQFPNKGEPADSGGPFDIEAGSAAGEEGRGLTTAVVEAGVDGALPVGPLDPGSVGEKEFEERDLQTGVSRVATGGGEKERGAVSRIGRGKCVDFGSGVEEKPGDSDDVGRGFLSLVFNAVCGDVVKKRGAVRAVGASANQAGRLAEEAGESLFVAIDDGFGCRFKPGSAGAGTGECADMRFEVGPRGEAMYAGKKRLRALVCGPGLPASKEFGLASVWPEGEGGGQLLIRLPAGAWRNSHGWDWYSMAAP